MAKLIDINNDDFWQVLFDEACVEGKQAERIEKELDKISTDENEIRVKAIEEFAEWVFDYTDGYYFKSKQELLDEWNKQLKA